MAEGNFVYLFFEALLVDESFPRVRGCRGYRKKSVPFGWAKESALGITAFHLINTALTS